MQTPTVGRVLLYRPLTSVPTLPGTQPLAAIVTYVWSNTLVNLAVFNADGNCSGQTSVMLIAPNEPKPENGGYCFWPVFQGGLPPVSPAA